jgi:hypothetical protein
MRLVRNLTHTNMNDTEFIKMDQWANASHYQLECGEDGVIRVKNGMSLDEYINHPDLVERRKNNPMNHGNHILISAAHYKYINIPRIA